MKPDGSQQSRSISYETENNELKKLHEERVKRMQAQKLDRDPTKLTNNQVIHKSSENWLSKKAPQGLPEQKSPKTPSNLFLNSLLSDHRTIKEKQNAIALSSLFQEDPRTFSTSISPNIKAVFMTTYGFEMEVLGPIAESGVPFYLVNDSQENGEGRLVRDYEGFKNMTLIVPPRTIKGYGVFHTKLWLIRFSSFLRVVICTGNQHAQDWIVWLNAYWYKDFQLRGMTLAELSSEEKAETLHSEQGGLKAYKEKGTQKVNDFKGANFKHSQKVTEINKFIEVLDSEDQQERQSKPKQKEIEKESKPQQKEQKDRFDFEEDFYETLKLVIEKICPQTFNFEKETGIVLKNYVYEGLKDIVLIPSIAGRHSGKQMEKYGMAKVKRIVKRLTAGSESALGSSTMTYNTSSLGVVEENFLRQLYFSFVPRQMNFSPQNYRVVYPSMKYITEETCGQAQVLFLRKDNFYRSELKKKVFYHYQKSTKNPVSGAIPHLKTIVVENKESSKCIFYVGSHNMTKAAWGSYEKSESQISFSNSELGVLFLNKDLQEVQNWLPYKYPPRKYLQSEKPFLREG